MHHVLATLVLIKKDNAVLLGMKKRGFGKGKWNGFGGKVEPGERILDAAHRECREEAGIECKNLSQLATLTFYFEDGTPTLEVHLFVGDSFEGVPQETDEMRPQWFSKEDIPFDKMWADDKIWFPLFFSNTAFSGEFWFRDSEILLRHQITEL